MRRSCSSRGRNWKRKNERQNKLYQHMSSSALWRVCGARDFYNSRQFCANAFVPSGSAFARLEAKDQTHEDERRKREEEHQDELEKQRLRAERSESHVQSAERRALQANSHVSKLQHAIHQFGEPLAQEVEHLKERCEASKADASVQIEHTRRIACDAVQAIASRAFEAHERVQAESVRADALSAEVNRLRADVEDERSQRQQLSDALENEHVRSRRLQQDVRVKMQRCVTAPLCLPQHVLCCWFAG